MKEEMYISDGFMTHRVTEEKLIALRAVKHEVEKGEDAFCYIHELDFENQSELLDMLDYWARDIPLWRVGEFFRHYELA
jgi:hypothetical protein